MDYQIKDKSFTIKTIRKGQPRPYADSEYEYEITVENVSEFEILQYCTKVLKPCNQTKEQWDIHDVNGYFSGYYTFSKIGENKYRYYVLKPYCV